MSLAIGESSRIASAPARNRRHVARIVSQLLAILDFARSVSALVVVVGVTSHLGSGAALSPRRRRIASVDAHNRTEMLRLRGVLLTILRLLGLRARLLSILAVYKRRFTASDGDSLLAANPGKWVKNDHRHV